VGAWAARANLGKSITAASAGHRRFIARFVNLGLLQLLGQQRKQLVLYERLTL